MGKSKDTSDPYHSAMSESCNEAKKKNHAAQHELNHAWISQNATSSAVPPVESVIQTKTMAPGSASPVQRN
jgi:hypothetical protein